MGKPSSNQADQAVTKVEGTFAATGQSASCLVSQYLNVSLSGGDGSVKLQRSFDGGVTWFDVSQDAAGTAVEWTLTVGKTISVAVFEPERGVLYRLDCIAVTADIGYRISG